MENNFNIHMDTNNPKPIKCGHQVHMNNLNPIMYGHQVHMDYPKFRIGYPKISLPKLKLRGIQDFFKKWHRSV